MFFPQTSVMKYIFSKCVRATESREQIFSLTKANFSLTYMFLKQTGRSMKHVVQLLNRNNFLVNSAITEACAIIKLSYSLVFFAKWRKEHIFLLTKDSISAQPYSVDEFLHVEMASHQQWEAVPLWNRHGAEGLQDDHICLVHVRGCCGVAVTQVD